MNIERVYATDLSAEALARAVAQHFAAEAFETQVFRTTGDSTVVQLRKESFWRQVFGTAYAITVLITPGAGRLTIALGEHEWVDTAVSAGIGLVVVPPLLLSTAYGIWRQTRLDQELWRVVDLTIDVAAPEPRAAAAQVTPAPATTAG